MSYRLVTPPTNKFFFWGIFRNKEVIKKRLGVYPDVFVDANYGERKGKLAIFNLDEEELLKLYGRLAIIEQENYILHFGYINKPDEVKNISEWSKLFIAVYGLIDFYLPKGGFIREEVYRIMEGRR